MTDPNIHDQCPYKGLDAYREEDFPFFFGRDEEAEYIVANILANRLTILYGPSGVGKSSLLNAGAVTRLRRQSHRASSPHGKPEFLTIIFDTWYEEPVSALTSLIHEAIVRDFGPYVEAIDPPSDSLSESLRTWTKQIDADVFLILDQFEQYLSLRAKKKEEPSLAEELPRIVNDIELRVNCLISLRRDALWMIDAFKGRIPGLLRNRLYLRHIDRKSARLAITEPIKRHNEGREKRDRIEIEEDLVDAVLDEVRAGRLSLQEGSEGARGQSVMEEGPEIEGYEAPFLQLVMVRLWEEEQVAGSRKLGLKTLQRLGGAKLIVKSFLEGMIAPLTNSEKGITAEVFRYLISPDEKRAAYTASQLSDEAKAPAERIKGILEKLSTGRTRLLQPIASSDGGADSTRYELAHDLLVPAALEWRREYFRKAATRKTANRILFISGSAIIVIAAVATFFVMYEKRWQKYVLADWFLKASKTAFEESQKNPQELPNAVLFAREGIWLVKSDEKKANEFSVFLYEFSTLIMKARRRLPPVYCAIPSRGTAAVSFSRDGSLVAGYRDRAPGVFEVRKGDPGTWLDPKEENRGDSRAQAPITGKFVNTMSDALDASSYSPAAVARAGSGPGLFAAASERAISFMTYGKADAKTGKPLPFPASNTRSLSLSQDGRYLAAAVEGSVYILRIEEGAAGYVSCSLKANAACLALSPDGGLLALSIGNDTEVFKVPSGPAVADGAETGLEKLFTLAGRQKATAVAIHALGDGSILLALAGNDDTIRVHKLGNSSTLKVDRIEGREEDWIIPLDAPVRTIALGGSENSYIAAAGDEGTVLVWELTKSDTTAHRNPNMNKEDAPNAGADTLIAPEALYEESLRYVTRNLSKTQWDEVTKKRLPYKARLASRKK